MHGLESAILAIFPKSGNWLDWPCPVSAALQNCSFLFIFLFLFLNMKPLLEVAPGLLVIQIPIQAVWKIYYNFRKQYIAFVLSVSNSQIVPFLRVSSFESFTYLIKLSYFKKFILHPIAKRVLVITD